MWRGHDRALASYGLYICDEWIARGYQDTCRDFICDFFPLEDPRNLKLSPAELKRRGQLPWWFGWSVFHESHRSNLIRKEPQYYGKMILTSREGLPYLWPGEEPKKYKWQHAKGSIYSSAPPPRQKST
jgi:hypothetical protein